ncbi:uncharacterized protein YaaR (DUF327 family) [Desulfohalotomaculum tongense]|uniref:YaaR family protein n=1 Tax=Desulforadius tongensis TaxID=1216062 RepID=UPI00195DC683|nr:YaaR family protein [Desulforadius tongensis]MBM7855508.1 uncharacterized protein YaaR (DUF327 family) [Desulforadius tongensis]
MKISSINKQTFWPDKNKIQSKGEKSFFSYLDMNQRDHSKEQLRQMLKKIKKAGSKLKQQVTEANIIEYRQLITEYLSYVLKNFYKIRKTHSLDYSTLYTRIEIIDQEVEKFTQELLEDQKENIDIMASLDKITGLLLDLYQ